MQKSVPKDNASWLNEIVDAYLDASETIPFGSMTGVDVNEGNLFHLAPSVCLKFRGIKATKAKLKKATDAALSSYVANENENRGILKNPIMGFAFCYVVAHFGLDMISPEEGENIINHVEANLGELEQRIST